MKISTLFGFGLGAMTAAIAAKKLDGAAYGARKRALKKKLVRILD